MFLASWRESWGRLGYMRKSQILKFGSGGVFSSLLWYGKCNRSGSSFNFSVRSVKTNSNGVVFIYRHGNHHYVALRLRVGPPLRMIENIYYFLNLRFKF